MEGLGPSFDAALVVGFRISVQWRSWLVFALIAGLARSPEHWPESDAQTFRPEWNRPERGQRTHDLACLRGLRALHRPPESLTLSLSVRRQARSQRIGSQPWQP